MRRQWKPTCRYYKGENAGKDGGVDSSRLSERKPVEGSLEEIMLVSEGKRCGERRRQSNVRNAKLSKKKVQHAGGTKLERSFRDET